MSQESPTEPITVRTAKEIVSQIDALARRRIARATTSSIWRFDNIWMPITGRSNALKTASPLPAGRVRLAEDVFADIAAKYGWKG